MSFVAVNKHILACVVRLVDRIHGHWQKIRQLANVCIIIVIPHVTTYLLETVVHMALLAQTDDQADSCRLNEFSAVCSVETTQIKPRQDAAVY